MIIPIEVETKKIVELLNEKFKSRSEQKFQTTIDSMIEKIEISNNHGPWKKLLENIILDCYKNFKGIDYIENFDKLYFLNEAELYFIYKLLLQIVDLNIVKKIRIHIMDKDVALTKQYFHAILQVIENKETSLKKQIEYLDDIVKNTQLDSLIRKHGNTKSISAVLLGKEKYKTFRVNSHDNISFDIKKIKTDESRRIQCPVCDRTEMLYSNNKDFYFAYKNGVVTYSCRHETHKLIGKKPVKISIKEYKEEIKKRGLNPVDFVVYNYKILFKKFKEENDITI